LGSPVVNLSNTPVTTDDSSASVTYTGSWSTWNDAWDYRTTEHNSSVTGDTVQYNFTGSSIKWIGAKYYTYGNADVYIDGAFIGTVDCYSPTKLYQQVLFSKTGLSNASHTIKIVVKGTKNVSSSGYNVGIDAFTSRFDYTPAFTDDSSASVAYNGSWSTWNDASDYLTTEHNSNVTGDFVQYTFTGTSVEWIGAKFNTYGNADVYIDGSYAGTVDCYNSSKLCQQILFRETGLSNTSHTIKIVVKGTKNDSSSGYYVDIDAFTSGYATISAITDDCTAEIGYYGYWPAWNDPSDYMTTEHNNNVAGSYVQYSFTGSSIEWIGAKYNTYGSADVYIDGNYVGSVDCYNSSKLCQQVLFSRAGLAYGPHSISVYVYGPKNPRSTDYYVDIDAFIVT
ncbi:MAG: hypothetical protein FWC62_02045, partial [Firmicutes bacterium]|nr:hypothetical protein [Bacillota bacterium]